MAIPPEGAAPDPSMEDILASIRRILDEEGKAAPAEPAAAPPTPPPADAAAPPPHDVLDLDESMLLPEPDEAAAGPIPAPPPAIAEPAPFDEAMPPTPPILPTPQEHIVAPEAAAAAASSVTDLMRTLASERATATHRGGPTIEDLVRAEIRPLLKEWLDLHLAPTVERLVRAEIERVVSRHT